MIDANHVPDVSEDEILARYAMQSNHFRSSDQKNPNHANIQGFPLDKLEQKAIALELAADAKFYLM